MVSLLSAGPTASCDIAKVMEEGEFAPNARPEFYRHVHNPDLFLIRLGSSLCHGKAAKLSREEMRPAESFWSAGHGAGNKKFGQLEKFELRVIDVAFARDNIYPLDEVGEDVLTLGAKTLKFALPVVAGSTFCHGDSGGPVFRQSGDEMVVSGVNSALQPHIELGSSKCDSAYVQIVAPVAEYVDWIQRRVADWEQNMMVGSSSR